MSLRAGVRSGPCSSVIYEYPNAWSEWWIRIQDTKAYIFMYGHLFSTQSVWIIRTRLTVRCWLWPESGGGGVRFKCQPRHQQKLPMAIIGWCNGFAVLFLICWNGKINSCSCSHSFLFYCFKIKSKEKTIFTSNLQCSASGRLLSVGFKKAAVWPKRRVVQAEVTNTLLLPLQRAQYGKWR